MDAITEIKGGFQKTKVGWIPQDWDAVKFSTLLLKKNSLGYGVLQPGSDTINGVPMLRTIDLNHIGLKSNAKLLRIPKELDEQYKKTRLEGGEIIISVMGTLGRTVLVPKEWKGWNVNRALAVSRTNDKINKEFLIQTFRSPQFERRVIEEAIGSAQKRINLNDLRDYLIILPPLPEQQKIAEILSTWDKAIKQSQNLIEQLKRRKKGLMQQLLTGKTRLKGFSGEWKEVKLGEYFTQRNEANNNNLPLLSVGINGVYPQDESIKKDTSNTDKSKYKRICIGDIGYNTMRMWQGRSALSSLEGIVSPAYTIVTPKEHTDSLFFSYLFKFNDVIHKFYRNSQGLVSDTWQCRFRDFSIVKVDCPPTLDEQKAIAKVLTTADNEIKAQDTYLAQLQAQKKGLMQQLLTGQKRVNLNN